MDAQLGALARAAEQGKLPPLIVKLVAGNSLIQGQLAPMAAFVSAIENEAYETAKKASGRKADPEKVAAVAGSWTVPFNEAINNGGNPSAISDSDIPSALTLAPAEFWPLSGGDGLELPAIRVPFEAINAWWLCGGKTRSAGGSSSAASFSPFPSAKEALADDEQRQEMDAIDKLFAADPNATVVEGEKQAWLLTGVAAKVARDLVAKKPKQSQ
jgi:hypothetical protein